MAHMESTVQRTISSNSTLWALKQECALLQSAASIIQDELASTELRHARMHNALQPCSRLPNEVLSLIFEVGAPSPEDKWPTDLEKSVHWVPTEYHRHVTNLSAACSRFHSIILNTPRCWTYVKIAMSTTHKSTPLHALAARLVRSQTLSFDLHVEVDDAYQPTDAVMRGFSALLSSHAHRCRSISSTGLEVDKASQLFAPEPALSALQHLDIKWREDNQEDSSIMCIPFAEGRRQERLLSLKICDEPNHGVIDLLFSTRNITRLWLELPQGVDLPDPILQACSALQHLCYGETRWEDGEVWWDERSRTDIPNLTSFRISPNGVPSTVMPLMQAHNLVQIRIPPHVCTDTIFDPATPASLHSSAWNFHHQLLILMIYSNTSKSRTNWKDSLSPTPNATWITRTRDHGFFLRYWGASHRRDKERERLRRATCVTYMWRLGT